MTAVTPLEQCARRYQRAQAARDEARDRLADAIRDAVAAGMTEVDAARVGGVDRMTVRKWLGKR